MHTDPNFSIVYDANSRRLTVQFGGGDQQAKVIDKTQGNLAYEAQLAGSPMVVPSFENVFSKEEQKAITKAADELGYAVQQNPPVQGVSVESVAKPKRKVNERDLNSPGQLTPIQAELLPENMSIPTHRAVEYAMDAVKPSPPPVGPVPLATKPVAEAEVAPKAPVPPAGPVVSISPEKKKAFQARYGEYAKKILPEGGMVSSHSLGVTAKIRLFSEHHMKLPTKQFTEENWEHLLTYLNNYVQDEGASGLVGHIERTLEGMVAP